MKTKFLIIFALVFTLGFIGTAFATHDSTYNHPTPFGFEPELPPCVSDREACQNPPICKDSLWNCSDDSDVFSVIVESEDIGGGSIDLDSELSPTFSRDWTFKSNSILFVGPLMALAVSITLIIPYLVLKKKSIPPRRHMLVIAASILIFFSIGPLTHIGSLITIDYYNTEESQVAIIGALISMSWGIVPLIIGIILLKKAKLRIKK